jgi:hypothetical protein
MRQDLNNYAIEDFKGGISSERKRGPRGAFKFGKGLDIHSEENVLQCNQALKKDSASVVTDLVLTMFRASDGNIYAFGDSGKIYMKDTEWTLAYTDTDGKITGAIEFESNDGADNYVRYLYWATQTSVKKIKLSDTGGTWSPTTVGTFEVGNANHYHTMRVGAGVLMICDGDHIVLIDREAAFNATALLLPSGIVAKSLLDRNDYIIIGAEDDLGNGWIFTWDRFADSWLTKSGAQGGVVNTMRYLEGGTMVQIGDLGIMRYWNFSDVHPLKTIPQTTFAYPGGSEEYQGKILLGMNGTKSGVYSIGRKDKNDPLAINLDYVPSHGEYGTIGALGKDGDDLYVAWKNGSTYGIDVIDTANKATGTYEGLEFDAKRPETAKDFYRIKIVTRAIPTGCEVIPKYKTNRDSDWVALSRSDGLEKMVAGETVGIFNLEGKGESYEVQLELKPSSNTTPEILSINSFFTLKDLL